jgi:predicted MFS family arabinose efflux permease
MTDLEERHSSGKLIVPALVVSNFANMLGGVLTSLLLIDIGLSFDCSVGVIGQITAIATPVGIIGTLTVGALSVRFKHKSLLLIGITFSCLSMLCYGLASTILIWFIGSLLGSTYTFSPMLNTIVGDYFPEEERTGVFGWINTSAALAYLIGFPAIGFIASLGGWRAGYLEFILPLALLGLFLNFIGLPSESYSVQPMASKVSYLKGFKEIFTNRSAYACLIGYAIWSAGFSPILTYGTMMSLYVMAGIIPWYNDVTLCYGGYYWYNFWRDMGWGIAYLV